MWLQQWFQWDRESGFRGFNEPAEVASSVFNVTTEAASAVSMRPQNPGGFKFATNSIRKSPKLASSISMRPVDLFCWSSPLIFTFSGNYKYVMFTYVYGVIKDSRSHWDWGRCFRGRNETPESAYAASLKPLNPLPLSHLDRRIHLCGLIETA
jgi:hypothetical protein